MFLGGWETCLLTRSESWVDLVVLKVALVIDYLVRLCNNEFPQHGAWIGVKMSKNFLEVDWLQVKKIEQYGRYTTVASTIKEGIRSGLWRKKLKTGERKRATSRVEVHVQWFVLGQWKLFQVYQSLFPWESASEKPRD